MGYEPIDLSRPLFLEAPYGERIAFTAHGREQLGSRFAEAGIKLSAIRTKAEALRAIKQSEQLILRRFVSEAGKEPVVEELVSALIHRGEDEQSR